MLIDLLLRSAAAAALLLLGSRIKDLGSSIERSSIGAGIVRLSLNVIFRDHQQIPEFVFFEKAKSFLHSSS